MNVVSRSLARIGHTTLAGVSATGEATRLVTLSFARALRPPVFVEDFVYQLFQVGVRSLPICLWMSTFAGMVLAYQFGYGLERFGAKIYIGQTTVTGFFRELGPILTALVVGGRVGAGIAAELGGMAVTEQIDALRALGADPLQRLVAPRLVAILIALPLLTVVADVVAFFSSMLIAALQYGIPPRLFTTGVLGFVVIGDFTSGLFKTACFAVLIGTVACFEGMRARGGTEGVGRATTRTVFAGALSCLVADFLLTKLLIEL